MVVKGGSADVSTLDDLTDRDAVEAFLGQQPDKGLENGFPCFSLPSIHNLSIQIFKNIRYFTKQ